ncbi:radical SAM protein [Dehalobacter sp. DCM]|uniref:radical SAM protein n=1 Tax=Dehalobacter sp. DCM TaxID=2907827 RepID=UPI0030819203|nr:radical SAM protein [Dehalobacter sp. DCM]
MADNQITNSDDMIQLLKTEQDWATADGCSCLSDFFTDPNIWIAYDLFKDLPGKDTLKASPLEQAKEFTIPVDAQRQPVFPEELLLTLGLEGVSSIKVIQRDNKLEILPNIHSLSKLYIEPTSKCNLGCQTCIRNTWNEPLGSMSNEVFDALIEQLKDFRTLRTVMFGGFGEPTFHPNILSMISKLKALGLKVEMVSNGTLLTPELSEGLIKSGLDTLWVSFDGTSADQFENIREGASFEAVVQNLIQFRKLNLESARSQSVTVGIAFVVMKKNINELKDLGSLARRIGAQMVNVSNVIPYTPSMVDQMVCTLDVETIHETNYLGSLPINIPIIDQTEATKEPLYGLFKNCKNISIMKNRVGADTGNCRFIQERCTFVRWDGKVSPCMGLFHSYKTYIGMAKTEREIRHYAVGDIQNDPLKTIWESKEYHEFREKVDTFDFSPCLKCSICDLAEKNEEDCFGNTFPTCGGCLWGQGVIQCP